MTSTEDILRAARVALPFGWDVEIDTSPPFDDVVILRAPPGTSVTDSGFVRNRVRHAIAAVAPATWSFRVWVDVVELIEPPKPAEAFSARMRRLRGDYGKCGACGEPFAEHAQTHRATAPYADEGPLHEACVPVGTCSGCHKPVRAGEEMHHDRDEGGTALVHDREGCKRALKKKRETERLHKQRERSLGKARALRVKAVDLARGAKINVVYFVINETVAKAEVIAIRDENKGDTYIASSIPGKKTIAFFSTPATVTVCSVSPFTIDNIPSMKGVSGIAVSPTVEEEYPGFTQKAALAQGLDPSRVVSPEEV